MSTYAALCLPMGCENRDKGGFPDEDSAWNWIRDNWLCSRCLQELEAGGHEITIENGEKIWWEITDPSSTSCGAEWLVVEEGKLEECNSLGDLFEAAGFTEVYNRNDTKEVEDVRTGKEAAPRVPSDDASSSSA